MNIMYEYHPAALKKTIQKASLLEDPLSLSLMAIETNENGPHQRRQKWVKASEKWG